MDQDPPHSSYRTILFGLIPGLILATILSLSALVWTALNGLLPQAMTALVVLAVSLAGLALTVKFARIHKRWFKE